MYLSAPKVLTTKSKNMSASMFKARACLMDYYGSGYGRIRFVWLCQRYSVEQSEECPPAMIQDIQEETAPRKSRRGLA